MRYRKLDADDDYVFGHGELDFLVDSPEAVRQSVATRLRLLMGEWYLDTSDGTPWLQQVLDKGTNQTYDLVVQTRVLQTTGVRGIIKYQSTVTDRKLTISMLLDTIYSVDPVSVEVVL